MTTSRTAQTIRRTLWVGLALLWFAAPVWAQTPVVEVAYDTARLAWDYTAADQARITGFTIECIEGGAQAYSGSAAPNIRALLISSIIPGPGSYQCVVYAVANAVRSDPSNQVSFTVKPVAPTNARIEGGS